MKKNMQELNNNSGITFMSLIICITLLLILSTITVTVLTGEGGLLNKATEAAYEKKEAENREELESILNEYNTDVAIDESNGFTEYIERLKAERVIDDYAIATGKVILKYKGGYYEVTRKKLFYYLGEKLNIQLGEEGENHLITQEGIDNGEEIEFKVGDTYTILDEIAAEEFNFVIPSAQGDPKNAITINLLADIVIDNKGYDRSAIQLLDGAILNLYIGDNVKATVNSGFGQDGEEGNAKGAKGGPGGYAGIEVPTTGTLNLSGGGTLISYGGNAGNGTNSSASYGGRRRWRCRSRYRW